MINVTATNFNDGVAYEEWMGRWSRIVGEKFLDWLAPAGELKWLDVGCGNGAFTDLVLDKCDPSSIHGVDPSQEQLDAANSRSSSNKVRYGKGEAQALPFGDDTFDIVTMALAINLPPDPNLAVAEMVRVTKPGGYLAFEVGDVKNGKIRLDEFIVPLGLESGFSCMGILINSQTFTKTSSIWGIKNNTKGTNTNRIVVFKKN